MRYMQFNASVAACDGRSSCGVLVSTNDADDSASSADSCTHNVAGNYNKAWSGTLVQEVRVGMSYYHNEAVSEADGLNTSEEVGISGVNLNRFSSGITTIDVAGYNGTLVGFAASLPWDRSERTWTGCSATCSIRSPTQWPKDLTARS